VDKPETGRTGAHIAAAPETALEIPTATLNDEAMRSMIDEWLVPAMVEDFLRIKLDVPTSVNRQHNGDQPL
jgi:hypothetical protein